MYSVTSMTLGQLATAFTIDWKRRCLDESKRPIDLSNFLEVCGNLVIPVGSKDQVEKAPVEFIHMSVRDYIRRRTSEPSRSPRIFFLPAPGPGNTELALCCLTFLCVSLDPLLWPDQMYNPGTFCKSGEYAAFVD